MITVLVDCDEKLSETIVNKLYCMSDENYNDFDDLYWADYVSK